MERTLTSSQTRKLASGNFLRKDQNKSKKQIPEWFNYTYWLLLAQVYWQSAQMCRKWLSAVAHAIARSISLLFFLCGVNFAVLFLHIKDAHFALICSHFNDIQTHTRFARETPNPEASHLAFIYCVDFSLPFFCFVVCGAFFSYRMHTLFNHDEQVLHDFERSILWPVGNTWN